jgi:hypothetical protein
MDPYGASSSSAAAGDHLPGRIRKRRYSTARIQPTRIKKVMQSDEEIGRMIASVPVAIGSVMEHFAERLLENAKDVMERSASKTLSPAHIIGAINRTKYLHDFLEPIASNFGGTSATTTSASPVTTPTTNGLLSRPFENYSQISAAAAPALEEKFDLNSLMRDSTTKSHLVPSNSSSMVSSALDDGKRRGRGRPKKFEDNKPTITILSPKSNNGNSTVSSTINGSSSKADLDRVLMPPPLLVPQRNIKAQQPHHHKVIMPKSTMISSNTSNNTQSSTSATMVTSSTPQDQPPDSTAISASF